MNNPEVSIGVGSTRATAIATISGGTISSVAITNPGAGYTPQIHLLSYWTTNARDRDK